MQIRFVFSFPGVGVGEGVGAGVGEGAGIGVGEGVGIGVGEGVGAGVATFESIKEPRKILSK